MNNDISRLDGPERLEGEEVRIARPRAHQPDGARRPGLIALSAQNHQTIGPDVRI